MTLPGNEGAEPATSCPICAFDPEVDDDNPMYDCSSCGEEFTQQESADASSNRCPQCRRFARRVADHDCEYVLAEREEAEDRCSGLDPLAPRNCSRCGKLHRYASEGRVRRICTSCQFASWQERRRR